MLKVRVNRKTWYRGKKESQLLRKDNTKCCVGFACLAAGLRKANILGLETVPFVSNVRNIKVPKSLSKFVAPYHDDEFTFVDTQDAMDIYEINDDDSLDDKTREKRIKEIGKKLDIEFSFYN